MTTTTRSGLREIAAILQGSQQQCDEDGTMIAVSRQALDETLAAIAALTSRVAGEGEAVFWRYFKPPFRVVERDDTYYVEDSGGTACTMRAMLMWPAHPPEETEQAERETWRLGEVFAAAANATHGAATAAILGNAAPPPLEGACSSCGQPEEAHALEQSEEGAIYAGRCPAPPPPVDGSLLAALLQRPNRVWCSSVGTGSELARGIVVDPIELQALAAAPVAAFTEAHGKALRSIKPGEVLTAEQWESVCAFVREQESIIDAYKEREEAVAAAQPAEGVGTHGYFAADPAVGEFQRCDTIEQARTVALNMLDAAEDEAADWGWEDEPPQICYGVVLGVCAEASREPAPEGSDFAEIITYKLTEGARACAACRGSGEVEELTRHPSGDPQDSFTAPAPCPECAGDGLAALHPTSGGSNAD